MKDFGINKGLVQKFDTNDRRTKGVFFGLRQMFWKYLTKLNVQFSDPCCDDAAGLQYVPMRLDIETGEPQFWSPYEKEWINVADWEDPTTTTTTTTSTSTSTSTTTSSSTTTTTTSA